MKQKPVHPSMEAFLSGEILLIDKPLRWTSFDAVKKIRILTGISKVGHAGTLDPLATGLLIICTGAYTKKISAYMGMEKQYAGSMIIGASTATHDLESEPENFKDVSHISSEEIYETTKKFTGEILQTPPAHSAIKKDGKPVYLLARKGKEVILEPRKITISIFDITSISLPEIHFNVVCTTGTYIRSLANDFGKALGTGAYLSSLRRTRIGNFLVDDALTPQQFEEKIIVMKSASER
ncbi:MAG: tRNA pseudouridine(55) synthase TruB [Parafilimonas sp.]